MFVTHEHGDHIKGVDRWYGQNASLYDTRTLHARKQGDIPGSADRGLPAFLIGPFSITPVAVPHDAREPAQFIFG